MMNILLKPHWNNVIKVYLNDKFRYSIDVNLHEYMLEWY